MTAGHPITRRTVLTALPAAGVIVAQPRCVASDAEAAADPDAEIKRLGAEFERLWAIEREIAEEDFDAARETTAAIVAQIAAIEPQGLARLRVVARVCAWFDEDDHAPKGVEDYEYALRQKLIAGVIGLVA